MSTLDELTIKHGWQFLTNLNKKPFLQAKKGEKIEYLPITSDAVKGLVLKELYNERGTPPARAERDQIHDAMTAKAMFSGQVKDIRIRTSSSENGIEIDLHNDAGECVAVTHQGWEVCAPSRIVPFGWSA